MSSFIPFDKLKKLRDSAQNGDERAVKIITMQLNGEDYDQDLADFFGGDNIVGSAENAIPQDNLAVESVKSSETPSVDIVASANNANTNANEFGSGMNTAIMNLISEIDKASVEIIGNDNINGSSRKGALETLTELKRNCINAVDTLRGIKKDISKKNVPNNIELK